MPVLECQSYEIVIIMSLKEGTHGRQFQKIDADKICQSYCDRIGVGVSTIEGTVIYQYGNEPYVRITLTQNPLNVVDVSTLQTLAESLASEVAAAFAVKQYLIRNPTVTKMFIN